jgi:hypothetical protein
MTITLTDNLDNNRTASRFQAEYTLNNGTVQQWWVDMPAGTEYPRGVAHFTCTNVAGMLAAQDVRSKTLIAHYADAPNTMRIQISSVQP